MTLSLDDVRNKRFRMARKSGYEVLEVDEFVDEVEATFEQLFEENENLKKQVESLRTTGTAAATPPEDAKPAAPQKPTAASTPAPAPSAPEQPTERIVVSTGKEASSAVVRLVELSTEQAERLVAEATAEAAQIRQQATSSADEVTSQAHARAEKVETEARAHAERLQADSLARAESLDRDIETRRTEMFAELEKQRDQLTSTVHALRSFEATYRSNLTRHLQSQIEVLASGKEEPADPPAVLDEAPPRPPDGPGPGRPGRARRGSGQRRRPDGRGRFHRHHRQRHPAPGRAARRPALTSGTRTGPAPAGPVRCPGIRSADSSSRPVAVDLLVIELRPITAYCLWVTPTLRGNPMSTAKATTAGDGSTTATRSGARQAPAIHALPVNDAATDVHVEPGDAAGLPVREGEDPWTEAEVAEVIDMLEADLVRFREQLETSTAELVGLLRDGTEGAGRDPADVGSANFERDAEMSLANNAREMLDQSKLALRHIQLGTYGSCDNCGQPIGKGRLQAFPRATLCVKCKQREERR